MFPIHDTAGHGMTCGDVTMNSFMFSYESHWYVTKSVMFLESRLNSNELPIENNLYIIIKIVLYVYFDVLVGFSSFLDF